MGQFGKIPGHSGTEFKHRVGFKRVKAYQKNKMRISTSEVEKVSVPPSELRNYEGYSLFTSLFTSFVILVFCGLIGSLLYVAGSVLMERIETTDEAHNYEVEQDRLYNDEIYSYKRFATDNPYKLFTDTGNYHLTSGEMRSAQEEFQRALKVEPYGKEARLGLIKILDYYCCVRSIYCEQLDEQVTFAEGMGFM